MLVSATPFFDRHNATGKHLLWLKVSSLNVYGYGCYQAAGCRHHQNEHDGAEAMLVEHLDKLGQGFDGGRCEDEGHEVLPWLQWLLCCCHDGAPHSAPVCAGNQHIMLLRHRAFLWWDFRAGPTITTECATSSQNLTGQSYPTHYSGDLQPRADK